MSNRREFLQISLAAAALPALAGPAVAPKQPEGEPAGGVVVEAASPLSFVFRTEAARLGLRVWEIHDDITDLWYHELSLLWKETPLVLAGVTLSTSLFCLETLARDHQMRVYFRAEHNRMQSGAAEHVITGTSQMVERASTLGEDWGVGFARLAANLPLYESNQERRKIVTPASLQSAEPGPMVSWIIAPRTQRRFAESL